jgi:hypothetical protein
MPLQRFMLVKMRSPLGVDETTESRRTAIRSDLDEHFFHVNPALHFENRLWSIISQTDGPTGKDPEESSDPTSLFVRFRRLVEEMPFSEDESPEDEVSKEALAALEAHALMHHVLETALRLFVVLSELEVGESPWIPLAELPANYRFRNKVKSLLQGSEAADTAVRVAIPHYGQLVAAVGDEATLKHAQFVCQWLMFFAELSDQDGYNGAQSHNQMKHGMAAIARTDVKWTFVEGLNDSSAPTAAELNGGYDVINAVSITYLTKLRAEVKGGADGWSLRTDNADPSLCLAISQVGICVVRSLWQVCKMLALPGTEQEYEYNGSPLPEAVFRRSNSGFQSISRELIPPSAASGSV